MYDKLSYASLKLRQTDPVINFMVYTLYSEE